MPITISTEEKFNECISKGNCIVDFYADWCRPCQMIAPVYESLSKEYQNVQFYKVNVDELDDVASKYQIRSIPAFVTFKDGAVQKTVFGASKENIEQLLTTLTGYEATIIEEKPSIELTEEKKDVTYLEQIHTQQEQETITEKDGRIVIFFYATYQNSFSEFCEQFLQLAEKYSNILFYEICIKDQETETIADKFTIPNLPSVLFLYGKNVIYRCTNIEIHNIGRYLEQFSTQSIDFYKQLVSISNTHSYTDFIADSILPPKQLITAWKEAVATITTDEITNDIIHDDTIPISILYFFPITKDGVFIDLTNSKDTVDTYLSPEKIKAEINERIVPKLQKSFKIITINPQKNPSLSQKYGVMSINSRGILMNNTPIIKVLYKGIHISTVSEINISYLQSAIDLINTLCV